MSDTEPELAPAGSLVVTVDQWNELLKDEKRRPTLALIPGLVLLGEPCDLDATIDEDGNTTPGKRLVFEHTALTGDDLERVSWLLDNPADLDAIGKDVGGDVTAETVRAAVAVTVTETKLEPVRELLKADQVALKSDDAATRDVVTDRKKIELGTVDVTPPPKPATPPKPPTR